jgi:hypothetical protein
MGVTGTVTLTSATSAYYIPVTVSGTTATVAASSATAYIIAWDFDASDTTAEEYILITGTSLGTPTITAGVLTIA